MSTPANFNGQRPVINPNDAAMLLIDHQSGLFQTVGDMPMPELRQRAAALAKMATLAKLPVITTASVPQGPNGPLIPGVCPCSLLFVPERRWASWPKESYFGPPMRECVDEKCPVKQYWQIE